MNRLGWMDGLRGLAATQVVLGHFTGAFMPEIPMQWADLSHYQWEHVFINTPLFLPFYADPAVFLFFVMSGVVLTYSFNARPFEIGFSVLRRIVRLGIPMAASMLLAGGLLATIPDFFVQAGERAGSAAWLAHVAPHHVSAWDLAHQILFEGLLAGYQLVSLLPVHVAAWLGLVAAKASYNGPTWTLHIEFIGSLLIIILVALRAWTGPKIHLGITILAGLVFSAHPLSLFVLGHLAADWLRRPPERRQHRWGGCIMIGIGTIICTLPAVGPARLVRAFLPAPPLGATAGAVDLTNMFAAVLIFFGIALVPAIQQWLQRPGLRWLGKISFALYLSHFPVLITVVCALFVLVSDFLSYGPAVALTITVGLVICFAVAALFEYAIDSPAVAWSRTFGRRQPTATVAR